MEAARDEVESEQESICLLTISQKKKSLANARSEKRRSFGRGLPVAERRRTVEPVR